MEAIASRLDAIATSNKKLLVTSNKGTKRLRKDSERQSDISEISALFRMGETRVGSEPKKDMPEFP